MGLVVGQLVNKANLINQELLQLGWVGNTNNVEVEFVGMIVREIKTKTKKSTLMKHLFNDMFMAASLVFGLQGWTDMGPADTDTDICSWPIFLAIPIFGTDISATDTDIFPQLIFG